MRGIVTSTDNRDPITTTLTVVVQDRVGTIIEVDVNPVELFANMLQNHPGWHKLKWEWEEFLGRMDEESSPTPD